MRRKDFLWISLITGIILLVPLITMQFTEEVDWSPLDFIIMGTLLFGAGCLITLVGRKVKSRLWRVIAGAAILIALILVWLELAVGIFGTPLAGS